MADVGFLDSLGLGGPDPRAVQAAQRREAFSSANQQGAAFGRQASGLVGGLGAGAVGLISGRNDGRSIKGFLNNAGAAARKIDEFQQAQAVGMSVEDLRSNRRIKAAAASKDFGDPSTLEARIKMAEFVAKEAQNDGNIKVRAAALQQLTELRKEKAEFDKLSSQTAGQETRNIRDSVVDVFLGKNTKPVAAQYAKRDGVNGVEYTDENGQLQFAPVGTFTTEDPREKIDTESLDQRIRRSIPKQELTKIKTMITTGADSVRKYGRVMDIAVDLIEKGGSEEVLSDSGKVAAFLDNAVRNVRGVASAAFNTQGASEDAKSGVRKRALEAANDPNNSIWDSVQLPERFRRTSSAAQNYRANIMELAYMAARLAEPSNRGLSDNDIKNALIRIGADTANPQVMMRRFSEMMADGASGVEDILDVWKYNFEGVSPEEVELTIGGAALPKYRQAVQALYEKHGVTIDPTTNRATFESPLDSDVQPGEGVAGAAPAELPVDDNEFLNQILDPNANSR